MPARAATLTPLFRSSPLPACTPQLFHHPGAKGELCPALRALVDFVGGRESRACCAGARPWRFRQRSPPQRPWSRSRNHARVVGWCVASQILHFEVLLEERRTCPCAACQKKKPNGASVAEISHKLPRRLHLLSVDEPETTTGSKAWTEALVTAEKKVRRALNPKKDECIQLHVAHPVVDVSDPPNGLGCSKPRKC